MLYMDEAQSQTEYRIAFFSISHNFCLAFHPRSNNKGKTLTLLSGKIIGKQQIQTGTKLAASKAIEQF